MLSLLSNLLYTKHPATVPKHCSSLFTCEIPVLPSSCIHREEKRHQLSGSLHHVFAIDLFSSVSRQSL
ncbi:hypothetical protein RchiOBHm_Chr3g0465531 [Rosa chinensis]|uniref:Uncharacterized protein n=1 Tax=Rosa chinensis TaxID=74649 RepID=A0A2P6R9R8_ROSCH|nr:hypothetical protein RchiOBHm_Chr3g0465531 [Rosa chinensis]